MQKFVVKSVFAPANGFATCAMTDDSLPPFDLPAVGGKKVRAAWSLRTAACCSCAPPSGASGWLSGCLRDRRDPALVSHPLAEMLRFRMLTIACGYEDAEIAMRCEPTAVQAGGRPGARERRGAVLTADHERCENMASRMDAARLTGAMVDRFCESFATPPKAITLDIDDSCEPGARGPAALAVQRPP